jgi:dihydropteroate synthase
MAVANLTPDSFSGDGLMAPSGSTDDLLDRVEQLARDAVRDGADLLDLGAESTRPGHTEISAADEIARLIPAIERLRRVLPILALSADTQKVEVAAAALDAGAHLHTTAEAQRVRAWPLWLVAAEAGRRAAAERAHGAVPVSFTFSNLGRVPLRTLDMGTARCTSFYPVPPAAPGLPALCR